jgi:integrase
MAWLYPRGGRWWIGYRHNGKQFLKSTKIKLANEAAAQKELEKAELLFGAARAGSLTEELYQTLTGATLPKITLVAELDDWLKECRASLEEKTVTRYEALAKEFKTFMNATDTAPLLSAVTTDEVRGYLNDKRVRTSAPTANLARKTLSAVFIRAVDNHHLRQNPVSPIKEFKKLKSEPKVTRRPFSLAELEMIHSKAPDEFWQAMILGGFYTGLRLGDLICLQRGVVDLTHSRLVLKDDKTEKPLFIPIAKPLRQILAKIMVRGGKPTDYLWPDKAAKYLEKGSGVFSSEFYKKILTPCGLVTPRKKSHKATGAGHTGKRQTNEISFHSLRHAFVSFLRSTGSNQAVAKELAGHASDQVNSLYTHVPEESLVAAINLLPEFVK